MTVAGGSRCAGFGLVEVAVAIAVSSVGVLGAAGVAIAIASQARHSNWDTQYTLAGRKAVEAIVQEGHDRVVSGTTTLEVAGRRYQASHVVTTPEPRLKQVQVTVASPPGPTVAFEILLVRDRPLPAAP
ncbi:prepilin-type N-terminal cleavage/methylation domain-containing protein [Candidatus Palauibacter sp.]|uniref:prepilin-type N-terminal cleavage/methylation domain-containing protein n=1 Tax=Candidatus Palauibacter sp. TaxID=3101350 RepID=UPI003B594FDB